MRIVGLTGGIATGKSTVSRELGRRGLPIIDADEIAHDAVSPGTAGYRSVVAAFRRIGVEILKSDGEIDRAKLGELVFRNPDQRRLLNRTLQPHIALALISRLFHFWLQGTRVVVLDAPLLFETKLNYITHPTIVVHCSHATQLSRLMERNTDLTQEQAEARIDAQMPTRSKVARANIVIDNSGNLEELTRQVEEVYAAITQPLNFRELILSRAGMGATLGTVLVAVLVALIAIL
eukprot:TRINITY_DN2194_c0_g1_i3.p1 TRINITY_DN2194_c0_g1~~TRINITY_DN2194_c0_g1_i3.p1  ORF type:complete len:235 (-),score=13.25 TRINITY_DN2194_c0_g1_i3:421-1125(-)